jgi:chorismate synthase
MGSTFGRAFRITTWGESHGPALGVVVDGCPAGLPLDDALIQRDLDRRRVGQSKVTSPRNERDRVQILSGVFEGRTTGAPISLITYNADADSSKYDIIRDMYRPGHADYTYTTKYGAFECARDVGPSCLGCNRPGDSQDGRYRRLRVHNADWRDPGYDVRSVCDRSEPCPGS